jgi:glycosyltransferase involved in cell wall biosynthesis
MNISFLITSHNESEELDLLLTKISNFIEINGRSDEIVILDDYSDNKKTIEIINKFRDKSTIVQHKLSGDFSEHKNFGLNFCKGEYVFAIDADEYPSDNLLVNLVDIISLNPDVDLFLIPRLNVVDGMTQNDINKWGWRVSKQDGFDEAVINFPDFQYRLHKNKPAIKWKGKLHERIDGFSAMSQFPPIPDLCLIHRKTIERQTKQNTFYNQNFTQNENRGIHT